MKKWFLFAAASLLSTAVFAAEGWLTDFDKAKAQAKEQNKHILIDFSGSDWCGWCIRLDEEVFQKEAFKAYAKENLVLLLVDWPQSGPDSKSIQTKSEPILKEFGVSHFPTVIVLSPDGKAIGKTGYQAGGPAAYVEHIEKIITDAKKKPAASK